jgi:hypothetical protein
MFAKSMKRFARIFITFFVAAGLLYLGTWIAGNLSLGYLFPKSITDSLADPQTVSSIRRDGLLLQSGRLVPLPWIREIPTGLPILEDAVSRGVEIDSKGHVFGLVRIHHWCGNDPVRKHLARVDLSNMLIAWGAETTVPIPEYIFEERRRQRYTKHGWNISDYFGTEYITSALEMEMKSNN